MVKAHFRKIRRQIIKELDKASERIIVAVYWFTNHDLFDKLMEKLNDGVKVEVIIHNDYINNRNEGLYFQGFIDNGGKFYFSDSFNPMHNKFCVIDDKVLINGSYNWTYYAENRNMENILLIKEEQETIKAFVKEFNILKRQTHRIDKIQPLTRFEVDEFNLLNARDYLANDIVFQASETGNKEIVESAFQIAPNNIEIQKTAFELNLTKRYRLKHTIGASLQNDRFLEIVPKGSLIPFINSETTETVSNNQTSASSTIYYGENPKASLNTSIVDMKLIGLPPKPAGEAEMKFHFTIDLYGNLRMEDYSLDNGVRQVKEKNISYLLVPAELPEDMVSIIDAIKANIKSLRGFSNTVEKKTIDLYVTTITKQLNSVSNKCATLDEADILLSANENYKGFSLLGIENMIPYTTENGKKTVKNSRFIEIDKVLDEVYDSLNKRFPEENDNKSEDNK